MEARQICFGELLKAVEANTDRPKETVSLGREGPVGCCWCQ